MYTTKHDVTIDDVVSLTQTMVQIDSSTPGSGSNTGVSVEHKRLSISRSSDDTND
jgi:hypothetical protein